ncbi:MAG: Ig-like domain-containing protein, partial [Candidatus Celaenobacter polaris]|nr:Ig-like domain-containing protein [Candidatus Celaenobacter polaris]
MKKNFLIVMGIVVIAIALSFCSSSTTNTPNTPSVTISSPNDGQTITTPTTLIKVEVSAKETILYVQFIVDNEVVNSDSTSPYEYEWNDFYWADNAFHEIKVTAYNSEGVPGSDSISVKVSEEAESNPIPLEPADNANVTNPILFKWKILPGAVQYDVHIQKDALVFVETPTDTTLTKDFLELTGEFTWKVRAQNFWSLFSDYSQEFHFTLSSSGTTPDFKYLGTWLGFTQYTDTVSVTISNVSNKEKITTIKLYYPNIDGTPGYQEIEYTDSDGIA